jgi:hypothetical protein
MMTGHRVVRTRHLTHRGPDGAGREGEDEDQGAHVTSIRRGHPDLKSGMDTMTMAAILDEASRELTVDELAAFAELIGLHTQSDSAALVREDRDGHALDASVTAAR